MQLCGISGFDQITFEKKCPTGLGRGGSGANLDLLAETRGMPKLVALCTQGEDERKRFIEDYGAAFPVGQITEDAFWQLLDQGDMPRIILIRDQEILQLWDQKVPDPGTVLNIMEHSS